MTTWLRVACALLFIACGPRGGSDEDDATECADGRDNDGDGARDCSDPGCSGVAFCGGGLDSGGLDAGRSSRDAMTPLCTDPIDLVFVIDVSTSMEDEVDAIRRGIDSIYATATALTPAVQMSLVVFVDDVVAVNGCAPFASITELQTELQSWQSFTSSNRQPDGGGDDFNTDCAENSVDALYVAATECPWRSPATRIIIHVTDDTFAERPADLSGVGVERTYQEAVSEIVSRQIRVGAFAAPGAGEHCGAGTSPNVGRGFHEPYNGMPSIPMASMGRAWSIRDVRANVIDMADAINMFTMDSYCAPF
jgi:hypothetical protein